jgi:hypothetical protein
MVFRELHKAYSFCLPLWGPKQGGEEKGEDNTCAKRRFDAVPSLRDPRKNKTKGIEKRHGAGKQPKPKSVNDLSEKEQIKKTGDDLCTKDTKPTASVATRGFCLPVFTLVLLLAPRRSLSFLSRPIIASSCFAERSGSSIHQGNQQSKKGEEGGIL